jgi:uncharacterized protein
MLRSPFLLNVADLLGKNASGREVTIEAPVAWGLDLIALSPDEPMTADLMLHPISNGIAVTGRVNFATVDTCHRCLDTTRTDRSATIGALFDEAIDDESYPLAGQEIDVEQMLRDEVILSLPLVTTCEDECSSVVDSAPIDLNAEPPDEEGDPRSPFAVLKDLLEPGE